jgi:hypothetical protein
MKRLVRVVLIGLLGLLVLCIAAAGISALSNRRLPTQSTVVDKLDPFQKARLAEVQHLRQALGDAVWPGWSKADIPIITYNEGYAFLVGASDPPAGWVKAPRGERVGGLWEVTPGDAFLDQPYYRQPLPDPDVTPENFTVQVGNRWAATLQTKEYAAVAFYRGFRDQLPAFLRTVFPYRLAWSILGGDTEVYIGGLAHEAFHAWQGMIAEQRLNQAELAARLERSYPWDDDTLKAAWQAELETLAAAAFAESDAEAVELARQFLDLRGQRRAEGRLTAALIDYEQQREWLEGLAKYAELTLLRAAADASGYQPLPAMAGDPDFESYTGSRRYWRQQMQEITRLAGREGETRFYYSGFGQAVLLDRFAPGWKEQAMQPGVYLEDLLRAAIAKDR